MHKRMERTVDIGEILYCREGQYLKGFKEAGYFVENYEIIYVKSGSLKITVNENVYLLREKSLLFAAPGSFVMVGCNNSDANILNCAFKGKISYDDFQKSRIFKVNALTEKYILNAVRLQFRKEEKAAQLVRLNIEIFLTALSGSPFFPEIWEFKALSSENYQRIFKYLYSNTDKMLELSRIAEENDITVSSLKATVYKYAGTGVLRLFNIIKVIKAMEYAKYETDTGVIAQALGFSDTAYFRKMFLNISGMRIKDYINGVDNERNLRKIRCVSSGI